MNLRSIPSTQPLFVDVANPRAPKSAAAPAAPSAPATLQDSVQIASSAPAAQKPAAAKAPQAAPTPAPSAPDVPSGWSIAGASPSSLTSVSKPARLPIVVKGYDTTNIDKTVRPQDNFYQYAVGGYLANHQIPADKSSWGVDAELYLNVQNTLHGILDGLQPGAAQGTNEQKLHDFYQSGMNQARIDAAGITPLQPELDRIDAIQDLGGVQDQIAHMHSIGFNGMFNFGATADIKNPDMAIGEADQGGLTMPSREYYLSEDPQKAKIRTAYVDHMTKMFVLAGDNELTATTEALQVLALETRLAEGCLTPEQLRDPQAGYNIMDRSQLSQMAPNFDFNKYFAGIGRPDIDKINVGQPSFFTKLNDTLTSTPVDSWKTYLRWQVINQMAPFLSSDIEKENFNFNGTVMTGATVQSDRWKRVIGYTDNYLGEALGQKFVEKSFPPEAKARAKELIENIKAAVRDKINNGWMSPESRVGALAKVDNLVAKIGYPDKWKDYSALDVKDDVFANNIMRGNAFAAKDNFSQIGKPVDKNAWGMTPSTVNAYYNPAGNEIVFPAAILQPPYFDVNADDAANYGGIGAVIGHELTHGFDDQGSQFDYTGRLNPWMTADDQAKFDARAEGVARQFDEFSFDGQQCNGHLVEGESIADLGGLEIAWAAFQRAKKDKPDVNSNDGFTPEQRFYLNFALGWATNVRPEKAHWQMTNDPHPLPQFRVLGPLSNLPSFYDAFTVKPGDPMMRAEDKRNKLWN